MSFTKRTLVVDAYAELALAGWEFDLTPEELQWALRRLDALMASWNSMGLTLGYALSATPDGSDLDDECGLPLECNLAAIMGLAVSIAAGKGKSLPLSTSVSARQAFRFLLSRTAVRDMETQQLRSIPAGAGSGRTFTPPPDLNPLGNDPNGLDFLGNA